MPRVISAKQCGCTVENFVFKCNAPLCPGGAVRQQMCPAAAPASVSTYSVVSAQGQLRFMLAQGLVRASVSLDYLRRLVVSASAPISLSVYWHPARTTCFLLRISPDTLHPPSSGCCWNLSFRDTCRYPAFTSAVRI